MNTQDTKIDDVIRAISATEDLPPEEARMIVRTTLTTAIEEAYEAGRKEKGNCKHEWRCAAHKYRWTLYYCVHCLKEEVKTD